MNGDSEVMQYFPSILSEEEVVKMLGRIKSHFDEWGYGLYATEEKHSKEFIGFIGLSHPRFESDFTPCVEIGWRLRKCSWGQGYATEGAKAVLNYAFTVLDLSEVFSFTALTNVPSYRVMEKIGMTREGVFIHPNLPVEHALAEHWLYRITQPSWKNENLSQ